jgi:hypothetical protein
MRVQAFLVSKLKGLRNVIKEGWRDGTDFYLASCFDGFTESTTTRFASKCVSDKLILGRMNNEGAVFHIFADAQKAQVANACLDNYLVIVLNFFSREKSILLFTRLHCSPPFQLTPLGRTAIIDGEIDTFTDVQLSGATSPPIFMMASFIVFMPTACCTSEQPRY